MFIISQDKLFCVLFQLFTGNKDNDGVVKNTLDDTRTLGRFIRFIPTKYYNFKALRVEVYGYRKGESISKKM